jgi:23S rRNA (cytosine1962-C5)-methyltransferase
MVCYELHMEDQHLIELRARIQKNHKARVKLARHWPTQAYRLYDRDLPNYPYIVDIYGEHGVVWFKGRKRFDNDEIKDQQLIELVASELGLNREQITIKKRSPQKRFERYQKLDSQSQLILIEEAGAKFEVNLTDYLDTGLFLDHRPLRREIARLAKPGSRFLNLFCYTGSVSVMAALSGATTCNIDLSNTYLEWAKRNFTHNQLNPTDHRFYQQSATDLSAIQGQSFDLIYVDPPTFSNSKKAQDFDVQVHHEKLLIDLKKNLTPSGEIFFSCNKRDFVLSPGLNQHYKIIDWTRQSLPEDFRDAQIHHCFRLRTATER